MKDSEQCKMCKEFPPCERGICCKQCQKQCNLRQCENKQLTKRQKRAELPWYLRDDHR